YTAGQPESSHSSEDYAPSNGSRFHKFKLARGIFATPGHLVPRESHSINRISEVIYPNRWP
ncbi:hypothetical protein OAK93_01375, partial [bacterium]|nr:hypothetical protein [bacterium]